MLLEDEAVVEGYSKFSKVITSRLGGESKTKSLILDEGVDGSNLLLIHEYKDK